MITLNQNMSKYSDIIQHGNKLTVACESGSTSLVTIKFADNLETSYEVYGATQTFGPYMNDVSVIVSLGNGTVELTEAFDSSDFGKTVMAETNPLTWGNTIPALDAMTGAVTASRSLIKEDSGQTLICTSASAIVLTIPNDATVAWSGLNAVAAYQGGAGAVSFAAGSGVTLRGTAPTATQYATQGVMRVGANEWAYL